MNGRLGTAHAGSITEVAELHRHFDGILLTSQKRDRRLKVIAVFSGDSHLFVLNLRLDFELVFLKRRDDLFRLLLGDTGLDRDHLSYAPAESGFHRLVLESENRDAALDRLALKDIVQSVELPLFAAPKRDRLGLLIQFDLRFDPLEIKTLRDFLGGLIDGIVELLPIDFG